MTLSPSLRRSLPMIVMLGAGAALGVGVKFAMPLGPVATIVSTAAILAIVTPVSILCWRQLDEVAREAHKTAWFWGGSTGMLLGFLALIWARRFAPDLLLLHGARPGDLVEFGLLGVVLAQLAGYLVVWAGWWLARR